MSSLPQDLRFASSHEWVRVESDGNLTVGISDYAQGLLGDLVYVELPDVGDSVEREADVAVVESVKAASDVYSPISGTVVAINDELKAEPGLVNQQPYTTGWLFKIKPDNLDELESLLDANTYQHQIDAEEGH